MAMQLCATAPAATFGASGDSAAPTEASSSDVPAYSYPDDASYLTQELHTWHTPVADSAHADCPDSLARSLDTDSTLTCTSNPTDPSASSANKDGEQAVATEPGAVQCSAPDAGADGGTLGALGRAQIQPPTSIPS